MAPLISLFSLHGVASLTSPTSSPLHLASHYASEITGTMSPETSELSNLIVKSIFSELIYSRASENFLPKYS